MLVLGLKLTWGIAKILCTVLLIPACLIGLVCVGMIYAAIPLLIILGIIVLIGSLAHK
jgi:hypothetical protein